MAKRAEDYNTKGVRTSYVSTVIGISLVLFMIGLVIGGYLGLDNVQKQAKESLQVDLFFKPELNASDVNEIAQELKTWKEFHTVYFVSPERAIEEFSGDNQNSDQILRIFEGKNPLPPTVGFKPKEKYANKKDLAKLKERLLKAYPDEIDEVNYDESSVNSVNLGFKQFVFLFVAVAILLIIIAVAMINNTIRLALYSRRFTIKTMQLVGATNMYIRKPFVLQAILQGLISAIIGMGLMMTLFYALNNVLDSIEISYDFNSFIFLFGSLVGIGTIITVISTWFALNKFLRMQLDDLY